MNGNDVHMKTLNIKRFAKMDLGHYQHLLVYGAGVMGRRMVQELDCYCADKLSGIAVTDMRGNPEEISSYPVKSISSYNGSLPQDNTAVIISVTRAAVEIAETVQKNGFSHIFVLDPGFENILLENYLVTELYRLRKEVCVQC